MKIYDFMYPNVLLLSIYNRVFNEAAHIFYTEWLLIVERQSWSFDKFGL